MADILIASGMFYRVICGASFVVDRPELTLFWMTAASKATERDEWVL